GAWRSDRRGSLLVLGLVAPLGGLGAGLIGALFRLTLDEADRARGALIGWAQGSGAGGFVLVVAAVAAGAAIAAWMVRRFAPPASGSGIPQVEAVLNGEMKPSPPRLIAVKFAGGALAIGSGLALGREGPSVQMGASIAYQAGKLFRRNWADCRVLLAAGAGAGLATAFNAPIAGAVFVLEELVKRFEARIAIAALGASAAAIWVSREVLGNAPDFSVGPLVHAGFSSGPLFVLLGIGGGLLGILYNRTLMRVLATVDRFGGLPVEARAAMVGGAVGALAWFAPELVGGGDPLTARALAGVGAIAVLPLLFLLRLGVGAVSYSAGTPGGLFAPLLVLGAEMGLWFGKVAALALPGFAIQPEGFAVVGMAALFTGIVRAPLTGIVLVTEMTANVTMLLPMIVACCAAMLVPTVLGDAPIYDSLRARLFVHRQRVAAEDG
ncbi:MAG TPA: H(+)/Cl(-) exchange transporter ClcA, partial [Acetobacteraceae bacterium]|nr:H(+)/Cl(-) exchange transporter ClcA [Acetobacteraceae bacterium]